MGVVRWILIAVVFVALLFISLQNTQPARLTFFNVAAWEAPLIVVVFVAPHGIVGLLKQLARKFVVVVPDPVGIPVTLTERDPFKRWEQSNVWRGRANGTVSAMASVIDVADSSVVASSS